MVSVRRIDKFLKNDELDPNAVEQNPSVCKALSEYMCAEMCGFEIGHYNLVI